MTMRTYPFRYKVQFYEDEASSKVRTECGISLCASYADAAGVIEGYYGSTLIAILHIELYEDSPIILLPEDILDELAPYWEQGEDFSKEVE